MASTLPTSTSDYKICPNEPASTTPPILMSQSYDDHYNNDNMHYGLTVLLDQQDDYYYPFFNYNIENFLCYRDYSNSIDSLSSDSNSMIEVPSYGTSSCLDYYCSSQIEGHSFNSSRSAANFDELERNRSRYSVLQNYVPSANNLAATPPQCWEFEGHTTQACATEKGCHNNNAKVRKYSVEERKDRILRYLNKRSQRNFRKTIKYTCRKTLADRRVRIRGRFAKNQEEEESFLNHSHPTNQQESVSLPFYNADHEKEQCKDDITEKLLQESIASLLYDPYVAGWHAELHHP